MQIRIVFIFSTLKNAGLVKDEFPMISQCVPKTTSTNKEMIEDDEDSNSNVNVPMKRKDLRSFYVSISYCQCWNKRFIPKLLNRLKIKCNLLWVRICVAWKRFKNAEKLLRAALNKLVMKGYTSRDMKCRSFNCSKPNKTRKNGLCMRNGKCRETCVMHKVKYKLCREACVGNKQNFLKQRIQGHMNDAVKQKNQNIYSDAFTNYSANHLPSKSLSAKDVKPLLKVRRIKR